MGERVTQKKTSIYSSEIFTPKFQIGEPNITPTKKTKSPLFFVWKNMCSSGPRLHFLHHTHLTFRHPKFQLLCTQGWTSTTHQSDFLWLHPGRLTWNLKITQLKRIIIFQTIIFRFHVNLPGCRMGPFLRALGLNIYIYI